MAPSLPLGRAPNASKARAGKLGATRGAAAEPKQYDYKAAETCPLCIEDLDATDLSFSPCPCGYRVCLFCFEQVKIHCKSQCPGCRREYGKGTDADSAQPGQTRAEEGSGRGASTTAASDFRGPAGTGARSAGAIKGVDATPGKRSMEEVAGGALPSGSTWGATAASSTSRRQSCDTDRPAPVVGASDESAWPSLASVSTTQQQQQQHPHVPHNSNHRQRLDDSGRMRSSNNNNLSSSNSASSSSSMDAETTDQVHQQQQSQAPSSTQPVLLHQAVQSGTLSGKDAAAHLMALLQRKDKPPHGQSLHAAGLPPPGFAPTGMPSPSPLSPAVPAPHPASAASLSPLNNLDNPVVPSPLLGRCSPICPPPGFGAASGGLCGARAVGNTGGGMPGGLHKPHQSLFEQRQQQQEYPSQAVASQASYLSLNHPQQQQQHLGTYSVWSGLPGIDFSATSSFSALWQGVGQGDPCMGGGPMQQHGAAFQQHHGDFSFSFNVAGPPSSRSVRPPPPGFGTPGMGGMMGVEGGPFKGTVPPGFRCISEGFNPLQAQQGGFHAGGMPVYRPHLGAV